MEHQGIKLSLKYKVNWGVAALGTALISGIFGSMLPMFYQDYLGLSASWIGLAATIYAIWNAINDPLFGFITDNTRSKLGRRIPYMRFTAPFLALTFVLVWFAPEGVGQPAQFWWMLVTMLLYDTAYTIIGLVYSALLPEVTESDAERNGLQISSSLFSMLGMILGFLIPDMVRPQADDPSLLPFRLAMIGVALVGMALIIYTTFVVKERREFTQVDKPLNLMESIKYTFTSKSFIVLVAENFMAILTSALVTGSMFYLADYVMQKPTILLLVALFVPILIMIPTTSVLRARFGVVKTQQVLLLIAAVGLIALPFVPPALIWVCLALAGAGLAGPQVLTNVHHGMRVMTEESFGPVVGIQKVKDDEEALALMNDSEFGLTAAIFSRDVDAAMALADRVQAGTVFLNRCDYLDPALAWTGVKNSGRGCTLSSVGFEHVTRPKSFHFKTQL